MIEDETLGPVTAGPLSAAGVVVESDGLVHLRKQSSGSFAHGNVSETLDAVRYRKPSHARISYVIDELVPSAFRPEGDGTRPLKLDTF